MCVIGLCTVQVQTLQAAPTLLLVLNELFRIPRKHKLLQLVRCLQHCTVLDDLDTVYVCVVAKWVSTVYLVQLGCPTGTHCQ